MNEVEANIENRLNGVARRILAFGISIRFQEIGFGQVLS